MREGNPERFPCSPDYRLVRPAPSYTPMAPVGTPQTHSPPAAARRLVETDSGPVRNISSTRRNTGPRSARFEPAPHNEASDTGSSRIPSRLAHHDPHHLAVLARPALSGPLATNPPIPPGSGCPQLTDRCDGRASEVSHLRSEYTRLTAHMPNVVRVPAGRPATGHRAGGVSVLERTTQPPVDRPRRATRPDHLSVAFEPHFTGGITQQISAIRISEQRTQMQRREALLDIEMHHHRGLLPVRAARRLGVPPRIDQTHERRTRGGQGRRLLGGRVTIVPIALPFGEQRTQ